MFHKLPQSRSLKRLDPETWSFLCSPLSPLLPPMAAMAITILENVSSQAQVLTYQTLLSQILPSKMLSSQIIIQDIVSDVVISDVVTSDIVISDVVISDIVISDVVKSPDLSNPLSLPMAAPAITFSENISPKYCHL